MAGFQTYGINQLLSITIGIESLMYYKTVLLSFGSIVLFKIQSTLFDKAM